MVKPKTAIELAHEAMRKRRESGEVIERLDPVEKARLHPKSLRFAINGKCYDCVGSRREIRMCPCCSCPLWNVRPYQNDNGAAETGGEGDVSDGD